MSITSVLGASDSAPGNIELGASPSGGIDAITGSGGITIGAPSFVASGTAADPGVSGTGSLSVSHPSVDGAGTVSGVGGGAGSSGVGNLGTTTAVLGTLVLGAAGSADATNSGGITIGPPALAAGGTVNNPAIPSISGTGTLSITAPSLVASGNAGLPAGLARWFKADTGVYSDAGVTLATDGQTVRQWNDQSGNAVNISQATSGNRPTYRAPYLGDAGALIFSGGQWLENTADTFANGRTVFHLFMSVDGWAYNTVIDLASSGFDALVFNAVETKFTSFAATGSSANTHFDWMHEFRYDGAVPSLLHWASGRVAASIIGSPIPSALASSNGLRVGNSVSSSLPGTVRVREILLFDHILTSGEVDVVKSYLSTRAARGTRSYAYCVGDSLTQGGTATVGTYPYLLQTSMGAGWSISNLGIAGSAAYPQWVDQNYFTELYLPPTTGHPKDAVVVLHGHNDLNGTGRTGAQTWSSLQTLYGLARATGRKVVAVTVFPGADLTGSEETERVALNALILGNPSAYDAVADIASDSRLQNTADAAYFVGDGIHMTAAGDAVIASYVKTALESLPTSSGSGRRRRGRFGFAVLGRLRL